MIDPTDLEKASMEAALAPLGEYVAEIGMQRPFAELTKQEVLTLIVFTVFAVLAFPGEHFRWNHLVSFVLLVGAVYFAFLKPAAA